MTANELDGANDLNTNWLELTANELKMNWLELKANELSLNSIGLNLPKFSRASGNRNASA